MVHHLFPFWLAAYLMLDKLNNDSAVITAIIKVDP